MNEHDDALNQRDLEIMNKNNAEIRNGLKTLKKLVTANPGADVIHKKCLEIKGDVDRLYRNAIGSDYNVPLSLLNALEDNSPEELMMMEYRGLLMMPEYASYNLKKKKLAAVMGILDG